MRILIADQLRDQRLIIRLMCGGHWVKEVSHSTEAISKAKDFDLIFTEVVFPGLAGNDYLSALRRATNGKIIVTTAQREGYEQMDMVIRKPFYKSQIVEAISKFSNERT
jgi:CheY-like chemotaxis protein